MLLFDDYDEDDLQRSMDLLQAVGAVHICHPSSSDYEPILPRCTSTSLRHLSEVTFMSKEEETEFYTRNIMGSFITVCCVALAAGLFLGLLTLDVMDLQIIVRSSIDEDEIKYATKLIPLVKDRHRLLVTLLIFSTLAYETLPIFLDQLMEGWVAVLSSTVLILIFGEIVPSGFFTGPNQLYLGFFMSPLVEFFMLLLYPIAVPLGRVLDYLVPTDATAEVYNRDELTALIRIQESRSKAPHRTSSEAKVMKYVRNKDRHWSDMKAEMIEKVNDLEIVEEEDEVKQLTPPLHPREIDMVEGALSMKTKLAMDVYTPLAAVYAVPDDLILDKATITIIYSHGFSRVPVYRRNPDNDDDQTSITGYLITRQLMLIDWDHKRVLSTLPLQRPTCVSPRVNLVDLLRILQTEGPVLSFVCARPDLANRALQQHLPIPVEAGLLGLITIVDIMESVLQDRIYDEVDVRDQNRALATLSNWAATKLQSVFRGQTARRRRAGSMGGDEDPAHSGLASETNKKDEATEKTPLLSAHGKDNMV